MKLRNLMLAGFCLAVFIALGILYWRSSAARKPFGVILFLSDGLTPDAVAAARLFEGGADHRLALETFPHAALLRNACHDYAVPDPPAAAGAIATGHRLASRTYAVDLAGSPLPTLLEIAGKTGRATGLISNGSLANPGLAPFYLHASDQPAPAAIMAELAASDIVDVALGGGAELLLPESKGGTRTDGRDLILELRARNCEAIRSKVELEAVQSFRNQPLFGFFGDGRLAFRDERFDQPHQPTLADLVRRAIQILQFNPRGYFLVVDDALAGDAAGANQGERLLGALLDFDQALATARRYAGDNNLIIAAGRRAIGGFTMNGYPLRQDWGVALLGTNAFGYPSITWASGPAGRAEPANPAANRTDHADPTPGDGPSPPPPTGPPTAEPAAFHAPAAVGQVGDQLGVGIGVGTERLQGFIPSTDVFEIVADQL